MVSFRESCDVPIQVVLLEEQLTDGTTSEWVLATTADSTDPVELWKLYGVRPAREERHRRLKCFWDLTSFRSTSFDLVANQVAFVLLAYSLMQIFLYYKNRVATVTGLEHQEMLLTLSEGARRRILGKVRRLRKAEIGE